MFAAFSLDSPGAGEMSRRDFVRVCTMAAAAVGLGPLAAEEFVHAAERGAKPSVIWLQFQECTGCTESLLRTSHPAVDQLILDLISLDYHETLMPGSGKQAAVKIRVVDQPMIVWLWTGGAVMAFGALLAAFPGKRRNPIDPVSAPVAAGPPAEPDPDPDLVPVGVGS